MIRFSIGLAKPRLHYFSEDENVSAQSLGVVLSADPALCARMASELEDLEEEVRAARDSLI